MDQVSRSRAGVIHNVAETDEDVLDEIRRYLAFFPPSAWSYPQMTEPDEYSEPRETPELLDIVSRDGRRTYDMRTVIDIVFDTRDWFEVQPKYGEAIICALAHLGGHPVAVVANQPQVLAGSIDAAAADKAAHFIAVADAFHLPLVFLTDNPPGMLPGSESEHDGVLRSGARMFVAQTTATTLKLHVTLRKAYGFGSMVMSLIGFDGQAATYAYPGGDDGGDECGRTEQRLQRRRRPRHDVAGDGTRSVLPLGRTHGIRRADPPPRGNPQRAAAVTAARHLRAAGCRGTGHPHRDRPPLTPPSTRPARETKEGTPP